MNFTIKIPALFLILSLNLPFLKAQVTDSEAQDREKPEKQILFVFLKAQRKHINIDLQLAEIFIKKGVAKPQLTQSLHPWRCIFVNAPGSVRDTLEIDSPFKKFIEYSPEIGRMEYAQLPATEEENETLIIRYPYSKDYKIMEVQMWTGKDYQTHSIFPVNPIQK